MKTKTGELLEKLRNAKDIRTFINENEKDFITRTPPDIISDILSEKGVSVSEAARLSGVGNYLYKLISGERKASRNVIIAISLGCGFSYEETQLLLRVSKFAVLDSRDKRDSVIIFAINNNMTVFSADDLLDENGFSTLI